jgi:hypothetical protein
MPLFVIIGGNSTNIYIFKSITSHQDFSPPIFGGVGVGHRCTRATCKDTSEGMVFLSSVPCELGILLLRLGRLQVGHLSYHKGCRCNISQPATKSLYFAGLPVYVTMPDD